MRILRFLFFAAVVLPLSLPSLHAQIVGGEWKTLHVFEGTVQSETLGSAVAFAGDVDADGHDDLIVGLAQRYWPGIGHDVGAVHVYSGATGTLLHRFDGAAPGDNFGSSVDGVGDIDGDGFADLIVGASHADSGPLQDAGAAYVFSGASGTILMQFSGIYHMGFLGASVAGAGDIDGDGTPDLIVGAPWASPSSIYRSGVVYVYSGATGATLLQVNGSAAGDKLGDSVAGGEDIDADGIPDLLVGAMQAEAGWVDETGLVFVLSGATGLPIHQFEGDEYGDMLGRSVAFVGDVDRDGIPDVIAGSEFANGLYGAPSYAGAAHVYSGATGVRLHEILGAGYNDQIGNSVDGAGDIDGDGHDDFIVGAPGILPGGAAYIYSGATGSLLQEFHGLESWGRFGWSVSGGQDVDGDSLPDIGLGAMMESPGGIASAGRTYLYSLDPFMHLDSDELSASGSFSVQLDLDFPTSEAGAQYAVLASLTGIGPMVMGGLEIPLTQDNVFNRIVGGSTPPILQGAFGFLDGNGQAHATLSTGPALNRVIGQTIYFAAVTYDVGPLTGRKSSIVRYLSIVP